MTPRVPGLRILGRLGEGSMGRVYEAEQLEPVNRVVALKVIKWGMDTEEVIARFESERQALAMMNHPSIAKVFDAGATESGRPYFAMELVDGVPLTEYCDQNRLSTRERLELFIRVCDGVQHAHQKGIIHRDLKPSNVIVTLQDGLPVPKIIDFGLARATNRRLTERSVFTEYGQLIGTPEYMAPEQAELSTLDIDTRADVYSLGVLLYELLTGVLPFDSTDPHPAGLDEIRRRVRDEEPRRPSSRVSHLGEDAGTEAAKRATDPASLTRRLSGDLDWIVMKALEKDRERRYPTASDLGLDIARHLRDEPVTASPPSAGYRIGKFVRRHRVGVGTGSLVALALVAGTVAATVGLLRARVAEAKATREAEAAQQVSEFLSGLFEVSDPAETRGRELTARDILDRGAQKVEEDLREQPLTRARMQATIGNVYEKMGLFAEAAPFLEKVLETRRRRLDPDDPEVGAAANALGDLYRKLGRFAEAEPLLREALDVRQRALGERHPDVASSLNNLGVLYENAGRYAEAEPLLRHAAELREALFGKDSEELAKTLVNLAVLIAQQGHPGEAEPLFRRVLEIEERVLGPDHPRVALACSNLGIVLRMQKKYAEARQLYERALEIRQRILPATHPDIARSALNLANLLLEQGLYDEAEPLYKRALEISEAALGPEHPDVARVLGNLAVLYVDQKRFDLAEATYSRALRINEKVLGKEHPGVAANLLNLGDLRRLQHRPEEAVAFYRRALAIAEKSLDPQHPDYVAIRQSYAEVLRELGRDAEADRLTGSSREVTAAPPNGDGERGTESTDTSRSDGA